MANIRSAEKQMRQAEKAKTRNRAGKSTLKSQLKKAHAAIEGSAEDVKDVLSRTFSTIDKSAKKKLIKSNTADRYKSRLSAAAKKSKAAAK